MTPVLLGIVIYLLLDATAFATTFHGVAVDASVVRMKAKYWGWTAALLALCGLSMGLLAAGLACPLAQTLLPHLIAVAAAGVVVGALIALIRLWRA